MDKHDSKGEGSKDKDQPSEETSGVGGEQVEDFLKQEADLLIKLLDSPELVKRNPTLEGSALVFKLLYQAYVSEVVVEVRLKGSNLLLFGEKIAQEGIIKIYFQNIGENPMTLPLFPESVLNGDLILPWKAGIIKMFFSHLYGFNEVLAWQSTFNEPFEFPDFTNDLINIISKCEFILKSLNNSMIDMIDE